MAVETKVTECLQCRRCSVLLDSARKVIVISGDEQTFELPIGYKERLHSFLDGHI